MTTFNLELQLPKNIFQEAKLAGLLSPESIEEMLSKEVKRQRVNKLFASADALAELDLPTLSMAEIEAEIAALRAS